ncbi:hypothetical protein BCD64_19695 [Nostoc sp. MBR 210]|uniref:Uncharacterized protein n=1 Tax=Nostoc spongiaeforme FACHB-130 TaxID=1357510 RepID=A0ABR8FWF6_9NOSO|nr:hypothetical protein [Nostoc spongiaeforme]MBD2595509.1 hypothetical protein [Nostoc spongiaeforme FACHB-130]OCQ90253.1 hypothetical protein BCD64_19695 [Nostoc sp. MBR 210]
MTPEINLSLPSGMSQSWQSMKNVVNQGVNSVNNSLQQVGESWQETATTTLEQAKSSIGQGLQTADQFKNTTSGAVERAIASSMNDWLTQHPTMLRLLHALNWAANHPIISIVIILLSLAIIFGLVNAIIRLFTTASFSLLQAPLKLLQALIKFIFIGIAKFTGLTWNKISHHQPIDNTNTITTLYPDKQQRLAEISSRLEALQQEQKQLLQEAAEIIATDGKNLEIRFSQNHTNVV